jgi:ABC-type multidrug transport system fused ATPase/permease subunit
MIDMVFLCFGSTYMGVVVPVTLFTFYWIQRYYLRTSRQLRLLELEAKSPLYQHFTETIEGVLTIRALGWEIFFDNMALAKVDEALKSMYLLLCAQRWLSIVLKLSGATLGVIVVALAVLLPDSSSGGSLGVALVSVMTFNESVSQMLNQWTQSEMLLGAVNRTRTFERDTPCEDSPEDTYDPGEAWPVGAIGVSDLNVTYQWVIYRLPFW